MGDKCPKQKQKENSENLKLPIRGKGRGRGCCCSVVYNEFQHLVGWKHEICWIQYDKRKECGCCFNFSFNFMFSFDPRPSWIDREKKFCLGKGLIL